MALDFPASPSNGQVYGSYTYSSSKGAWQLTAQPEWIINTGSTPPSSPSSGQIWFDTDTGTLYVYYNDGNSSQWVQVQANSALEGSILSRLGTLEGQSIAYGTLSQNYIINGGMDIWQRGTSSTTSVAYLADRWLHTWLAGTATVSQSTDVPSGSGLTYSLSIASTSGTNPAIQQRIESSNAALFAGKTMTISVWAKSTVGTGTLTWATYYPTATDNFTSVTADASGTFSATMTVGSWTRYSATFTANSLATRGYTIQFFRNVTTTSTTTFYAGAQLEVGTTATSFRRNAPSIQAELMACQRYFEKSYPTNIAPGTANVGGPVLMRLDERMLDGGGYYRLFGYVQYRVEKRITPTGSLLVTYSQAGTVGKATLNRAGNSGTAGWYNMYVAASSDSVGGTVGGDASTTGFVMTVQASTGLPSLAFGVFHYTADAEL